MRKLSLILGVVVVIATIVAAQPKMEEELISSKPDYPEADIDYSGFAELTDEVEEYRLTHMASLEQFIKWSKLRGVIVLDTRSKEMYDMKHVKGAVHLNFSDFTAGKLAKIIPTKGTKILIYCNNNLDKDEKYFARKSMSLALNIPTFINLYGYGYKNVYELDRLVPTTNSPLEFEGKAVKNVRQAVNY